MEITTHAKLSFFNTTSTPCRFMLIVLVGILLAAVPGRASAADREIVTRVKANYPELAKRLKISGTVLLNAVVEPNGHVKSVNTVMGNNMLAEAAKEAVAKWKFAPADGETNEEIEIEFP
jgi:TonB family protein